MRKVKKAHVRKSRTNIRPLVLSVKRIVIEGDIYGEPTRIVQDLTPINMSKEDSLILNWTFTGLSN